MAALTAGMMIPGSWSCGNGQATRDRFGELLPLRKLGKTGEKVTMLGVGGYHVGSTSEKEARKVIETAIEGGIRFFDTAHNYGRGTSEERYGKWLVPQYRDQIFLMTKTQAPDGESLLKEVDLSLTRLNTDRVDLLQIHSLKTPEDVDQREENGVLDAMEQILETGKARHIGFTGHQNPYAHLRMIGKMDDHPAFSTLQMPVNILDYASEHSFIRETLPAALEKDLGILAMKTLADGRFFSLKQVNDRVLWKSENPVVPDYFRLQEALHFSWSLPISVLITGADNSLMLQEKIGLAKDFVKFDDEEKEALIERVSNIQDRGKVEYYKRIEV